MELLVKQNLNVFALPELQPGDFFFPPIIIIDVIFFNFQIRFYIYLFEMSSRYF